MEQMLLDKISSSVFLIVGLVFLILGFLNEQTTFWILGFSLITISNATRANKKEKKE